MADSDSDECGSDVQALTGLGLYDVICGRHKQAFNNIGNRRFRVTISLALARYMAAQTRKDKSVVIKSVVVLVKSNGGRFLSMKDGEWVELDEKHSHEKAGHALRDMALASTKSAGGESKLAMANQQQQRRSKPSENPNATSVSASDEGMQEDDANSHLLQHQRQNRPSNEEPIAPSQSHLDLNGDVPYSDIFDDESIGCDHIFSPDEFSLTMPWQAKQYHDSQRPSLDDSMLSWLMNESDAILADFDL